MIIRAHAYARAGLIGNPSDGYNGKTISVIVRNFCAEIVLYESPALEILPQQQDHSIFGSLRDLIEDVRFNGYYGGVRLVKATVKKFGDYCAEQGIALPDRNFTIGYSSTIPRHVGLAGSSAIVTATLRGLMQFYEISIPKPIMANLTLSVENSELGISAGLQDRVIQAYEGVVYMDFARDIMAQEGYGYYEPIDPALLPPLYIAYRTELAEPSERFHNNVRQRYVDGDRKVIAAMEKFASFAVKVKELILQGKGGEIGPVLDANFDLRMKIFKISERNIQMVNTARGTGASAKFTGSGGAIIGSYKDEKMYLNLRKALTKIGCKVVKPKIA